MAQVRVREADSLARESVDGRPGNAADVKDSPRLTEALGTSTRNAVAQKPPSVVEIIGPAGCGKTTLLRVLTRRDGPVLSGELPMFRRLSDLPFLVGHGLLLAPTLIRLLLRHRKWLSLHELRCMITLSGWHRLCQRNAARHRKVLLLDQAAVFMMVELYEFGPESLRSQTAEKWWREVYAKWASTLDLIVWLDASNTTLRERIRSRRRWHLVKDKSESETFEFLERYRKGYERVISTLTANSGRPRVLRIDTGQESTHQTINMMMREFGLERVVDERRPVDIHSLCIDRVRQRPGS